MDCSQEYKKTMEIEQIKLLKGTVLCLTIVLHLRQRVFKDFTLCHVQLKTNSFLRISGIDFMAPTGALKFQEDQQDL